MPSLWTKPRRNATDIGLCFYQADRGDVKAPILAATRPIAQHSIPAGIFSACRRLWKWAWRFVCGCSSVGRTRASHARGMGLEPRCTLQFFCVEIVFDAVYVSMIQLPSKKIIKVCMTRSAIPQRAPMPVEVEEGKNYFWCSCGKSANQPFCDGSHKDTTMTPIKFTALASKKVFFCGCKKSANSPLCDGTHSKL